MRHLAPLPAASRMMVAAAESDPDRYYLPAYIGARGWVAIRLDVAAIDWDEVAGLAARSYRRIAPKRLAELSKAHGAS
jgi:hypothetical protein